MPEESAVGATARATTSAGTPRASDQTAAIPGPAASRNRLSSSPGGGGGSGSPYSAAICVARSSENVNTALALLPTCSSGSPTTPRGSSLTRGTESPVASSAASASATSRTSASRVDRKSVV